MDRTVPESERSTRGRPQLCGALWGAGVGLLISFSCLVLSRDVYATLVVLMAAPFVVAISIAGGMMLYRAGVRRSKWSAAPKAQVVAVIALIALAAGPWVAQTMHLYYIAYYEIPAYPASIRRETVLHRGAGPKLNLRLQTAAQKTEVLQFYDAELRQRGWSTHLDPAFNVSATKPGYALFVYYNDGEIRMDWYRSYQTH